MKKELFRGSAVAIATPFAENGKVDYRAFERAIHWQLEQGTQCITVCGTTGECATLTENEYLEVVGFCVRTVDGRVPVLAGSGTNSTRHSAERSLCAQSVGADALLIVNPYYNKSTQAGLIAHYTYIADRVDIPVILYNVPSRTGMSFTADTYAALAAHRNILGVKEASGNMTLVLETRSKCPEDFYLYSGNDDQIVPLLAMGASGVISVLANIAPADTQRICTLFFEGRLADAERLQTRYCELIGALFCEANPIPVKAALRLLGRDSGLLRLPLIEMSRPNRARLEREMRALGLMDD